MATLGIELCDAAFHAAAATGPEVSLLTVSDAGGANDWPGFAYHDGEKLSLGQTAEDLWLVHPRRVTHSFWSRLAHEPSTIGPAGKAIAYSELAFRFLREFCHSVATKTTADKTVLAVPGAYLKDSATEEEKIGLLLGMAGDLQLPLAGIVDLACASLCDPRAHGFNPALPVVVIDLHLDGADLTLLGTDDRLERKDFIHLPQSSQVQLLKHLTGTMGNRFLRHTAFDILEDGRIEQSFFRQTKNFLLSGAAEHRFQINTTTRTYEMLAKRDQLASDAQAFVSALVQGLQTFLHNSPHASEPCTVALTDRVATLPGMESRLRAAGYHRILRLAPGAGACGAARLGESRPASAPDLADVPVESAVPISLARRSTAGWESRLQKPRQSAAGRLPPTHLVIEGIGRPLGGRNRLTLGVAGTGSDVVLPEILNPADDCIIPLEREKGQWWLVDTTVARNTPPGATAPTVRTAVEAGDRLTIRCGQATAEILFVHCESAPGPEPVR